jgi:hypothetical protein
MMTMEEGYVDFYSIARKSSQIVAGNATAVDIGRELNESAKKVYTVGEPKLFCGDGYDKASLGPSEDCEPRASKP